MSENLPNKAVFQSYIWTCAKYDFSPYEKRIIYRLIEFAQRWLEGIKIKDHMHKIEPSDCGVNITMPVASILRDEDDHNYAKAKAAFTSLSKKGAEYEDDKIWFYTAIIEHPKIEKGTGIATFHVYDPIWRAALDFTKGFKKYELITAMKFKSVYAMRFYELMSGQTQPLFVSLEGSDGLRERFCLQGKYERVNDFKRYVIDAAKKELDESSPYSFVAKEEKEGKKVIGWTLFPVFFEDREDPARRKRSELKSRGGSAPASLLFYGLPNLSAFSLSCSACSFNSLARSNASACFLLRYSKPFTESVRLRMKALSRSRLNFVSSKSRLLPSAFPFIRI